MGYLRALLLGLISLSLAGCGFKMQGVTPMPFDSLAVTIPQNSQFGADVRRAIRAASPNTVIIEPTAAPPVAPGEKPKLDPKSIPQARLEQVSSVRNTRIVALNVRGKPEEYELSLAFTFRLINAKNQIVLPNTTLSAVRSMPFDERVVQAKEGEAATIFRDMERSLVARLMRRLTAPDIKQRWEELNTESKSGDEKFDLAEPVQQPSLNMMPWQNPSLEPAPIPVNPGG